MLKQKILQGGFFLTNRVVLGMVIAAVGSVVLLRLLGLKAVGLYGVVTFLVSFLSGQLVDPGIGAYLTRKPAAPDRSDLRTATTLLYLFAIVAGVLLYLAAKPLAQWYGEPELELLVPLAILSFLPFAWSRVPMCLLDRDLEYKKIAWIELASTAAYYGVAIAGALAGWGALALVVGEIARVFTLALVASLVRPWFAGFGLSREQAQPMLRFGFGYAGSLALWNFNGAIAPLLVGKMAGLEALGVVRTAYAIVNQLSLLKNVAWRLSLPAIAKIQEEKQRVVRAVAEGVGYQLWLAALPLFCFASQRDWIVPLLYGEKWRPAATVLMLACLSPVVNAVFSLHSASLYAAGRPMEVTRFIVAYTAILWPAAAWLISQHGALGLPMAEILVLPLYWLLHRSFERVFGRVEMLGTLALVALLYAAAVAAGWIGTPWISVAAYLAVLLVVLAVSGSTRRLLGEVSRFVWNREWASR